jgi:hypothetical protein
LTKYFVIATIIVVTLVAAVATWWMRQPHKPLEVASVNTTMAPRPDRPLDGGVTSSRPFIGDAAWALSALPECVQQVRFVHGPRDYVLGRIPAGAVPIAAPATLAYRDCTIEIGDSSALVRRGNDRLRIPPVVHFYRSGVQLLMLRLTGSTAQLRFYVTSNI